ncbi:hypothetical protein FIV42_08340 [Persicimonas caeni]|uniref:DUF3996 domain-containing protein n=1 Tax=Persicimonas caeni TaxID=2292766 RepID=A0A4Y6PRU2_PERCE|nr:hypothetical protein [Persicimonas caeni]QDG50737.1 hypothetical protein FIV42_08340 [Persicimonas caeni]QED31958.1 hypothetical protein FRD00_08335 [Persicimonas caeni]
MTASRISRLLITVCCTLLFCLVSSSAFAQRAPNGFGIGIGAATVAGGLSIKTGTASGFTFQGVVGPWRGYGPEWRYGADSIAVAGDFLYEQAPLASGGLLSLGWNYGVGVGAGFGDWGGAVVGVTGVLGLEFNFVPAPIDVVLEYRPGLYIGENDFDIAFWDVTPHIRLWF